MYINSFEERIVCIGEKIQALLINIVALSVGTECQKSSGVKRSALKESSSRDAESSSGKLERRASFRQKFGALLKGSAALPAAINRGLQPIRRSLSFSKDLHRSHESLKQPYRTSSVQWYNSLSSLAEDERVDAVDVDCKSAGVFEDDVYDGRVQVSRTRSLMEKNPVRISRYFTKRSLKKVSKFCEKMTKMQELIVWSCSLKMRP